MCAVLALISQGNVTFVGISFLLAVEQGSVSAVGRYRGRPVQLTGIMIDMTYRRRTTPSSTVILRCSHLDQLPETPVWPRHVYAAKNSLHS